MSISGTFKVNFCCMDAFKY